MKTVLWLNIIIWESHWWMYLACKFAYSYWEPDLVNKCTSESKTSAQPKNTTELKLFFNDMNSGRDSEDIYVFEIERDRNFVLAECRFIDPSLRDMPQLWPPAQQMFIKFSKLICRYLPFRFDFKMKKLEPTKVRVNNEKSISFSEWSFFLNEENNRW